MDELFKGIDDKQKQKLLKVLEATTSHFKKNNIILSSVKKNNIICIVLSGHIQIIKTDYNGNRTIIENLKEHSVFGSITSSIANNEYDIITKADSTIIIIDLNEIINYSETNTNYFNVFLKNLLKIMSDKIKLNNERIEILTNKTIRDKLLAYFKINVIKNESKTIYLPFSLTDLADYLAVNRSAMSRELKNLKDEGLIEVKNGKIKLLYFIET